MESLLSIFFAMLVGIPAVLFILWILGYTRESEVVSSRPIGNFVSMSGPGGLKNSVVIETDTGSYPLLSVPVIVKGTALVLELRGNDQRFVCDASRTLCIKSAREEFTNTPGGNKS